MKKLRDIGRLLAPVLAHNADVVCTDTDLIVQPLGHVYRGIFLEERLASDRCYAHFSLSPTIVLDYRQEFGSFIGSKLKRGMNWVLDYPIDSVSKELCRFIEAQTLPLLRSTATLEAYYAAAIGSWSPLRPDEHFLYEVAMGNFDAARMLMRWHRKKRFREHPQADETKRAQYAFVRTLCELVDEEDYGAVAKLLREMEELSTTSHGVHHLWQQTPFPFEVPAVRERG